MILVGRLLSPFVRRVLVTLNVYGMACQRSPLTTASDGDAIGKMNPLRRVPALVLDDGEALIDSIAIVDYLDDLVGPERALVPASGVERRKALKLLSLAVGVAEKAVVAHYEKNRRPEDKFWDQWFEGCAGQALAGLAALEGAAPEDGGWLAGPKMSQVDITTAVTYEFINVVLPDLIGANSYPRLVALAARMNEIEAYASTHPSTE
ncbi:MAG: glutathione S-transferase family protein [Rhodospirillales bacterium]|nr:glutathione S-transferase family protein [Rhodospirillales bacterium]